MAIVGNFPLFLFFISLASPFGIPLGETFFIMLAGSLSDKFTDYTFFVTLIFFGLIIGDIAAYALASYFEIGLTEKLCKYDRYKKTCELGEDFFNKYGALSIFLTRFLQFGLGALVNYLSGFSKYSFRKFLVCAASGEFLYAAIYTYIGFVFKDSRVLIFNEIIDFSFSIILILAGLLALFLLKKHLISSRK
jgi:membrane-associated protein